MLKIITIVAVMATLVLADGPVLKTGQVKSYGIYGIVVTDGSIKDDGYYRAGVSRSYSRIGTVVRDNATGLEWLDNVSIQKKWVDASGDTAAAYCATLYSSSKYDWRLPTIQELQTLVDSSQHNPAVTEGTFTQIVASTYWSSTARTSPSDQAWGMDFYDGDTHNFDKSSELYVLCVRNKRLEPSNLNRNNATEIVTDGATGLQWQDDNDAGTIKRDWTSAIDYCEDTLTLGGYTDWRLPNKNELYSIVDYTRYDPAISPFFLNISSSNYWSSTSESQLNNFTWIMDFRLGKSGLVIKSPSFSVRCVRGGQLGNSVNPSIIMYLLD